MTPEDQIRRYAFGCGLADSERQFLVDVLRLAVEQERAACEQAVRDSGVKVVGKFACAFETLRAAREAIRARGKVSGG